MQLNSQCRVLAWALTCLAALPTLVSLRAGDQPQWGEAWGRNMVSRETGLASAFDPKSGLNLKWHAKMGTESYSTPIVAGGRVYIGANNAEPRDPSRKGDMGVLLCFDEKDGRLLWQLLTPKREDDPYYDWPRTGMSSPVTVEGDRVYTVNNRGEVLCLDPKGMANGNDGPFQDEARQMTPRGTNAPAQPWQPGALDGDILWLYDLTAGAGIWSHDGAHSSILILGDYLYLNTATGVDNTHRKIRTPDAPSLVVLDKRTGRLLARDEEKIAPNIFHCTWSSPSLGVVDGKQLVFFAGGNGIVYAFEPLAPGVKEPAAGERPRTLKKVWQFDFDPTGPKEDVHRFTTNRREGPSNIYGMPVFVDGRIYVAGGGDWFWGKNEAWMKCFEARGTGDITAKALVWSYTLGRHTMSTPAVDKGLVYVADSMQTLHCVDAATGKECWTHELGGEVWSSAMVADGKVYLGTRRGNFWVLAAGREKKVLSEVKLGSPISATATAANGVVYVATMTDLYAVEDPEAKKH